MRHLLVLGLLSSTFVFLFGIARASGNSSPSCFGERATISGLGVSSGRPGLM
jgi:hypothetical protein